METVLIICGVGVAIYFWRKAASRKNPVVLGREVGVMAARQLSMPFILTDNLQNGEFLPPQGFFDAPYIVGFCISFINTMRNEVFANKTTSDDSRNAFTLAAVLAIDPKLNQRNGSDSWVKKARGFEGNPDYARGLNHASALALALIGKLDVKSQHPLIVEARDLSAKTNGFADEVAKLMGQSVANVRRNDTTSANFTFALHEITIGQYIRDSYPKTCT